MARTPIYLMILVLLVSLSSCTSFPSLIPPSATPSGPRTLVLDGQKVTEGDVAGLIAWYCRDFVDDDRVLVELGYFGDPTLQGIGFVLFDGGYTGVRTYYRRTGLEHRWDWGPNGTDYAFVIQPDGTGLYYDFTSVPKGQSTKASAVYKCYQRLPQAR